MKKINVLIVDDNPSIHLDFKKILTPKEDLNLELELLQEKFTGKSEKKKENFKFFLDSAFQGEEALKLAQEKTLKQENYSLAFVDVRMPPGIDGIETAKRLWEIDPCIQVIICTAYSDYPLEKIKNYLETKDRFFILKKPFENIEILQLANTLANKWRVDKYEQKHAEKLKKKINNCNQKLAKSSALIQATFEASDEGLLVLNHELRVVNYNKRFLELIPLSEQPEQICNRKIENLFKSNVQECSSFIANIKESLTQSNKISGNLTHVDDDKVITYSTAPYTLNAKVIGVVVSFKDTTKENLLKKQLMHKLMYDNLTSLYNRTALYDRINWTLSLAKHETHMVAILFIDLDRFKKINETFTYETGDHILIKTAERMKKSIAEDCILGRLGEDKFIIVIPAVTNIEEIASTCQDLLTEIAKPISLKDQEFSITASIGVSIYPKDGLDTDTLLKNAETAKGEAKKVLNNFTFFTMALNLNVRKHLALEGNLRLALEKNEFTLYYQPLVQATTNKIIGVEALLRWQHPKTGMLLPEKFISAADNIGLMVPIGYWVLMTACKQLVSWQKQGISSLTLAVNFTSQQLAENDFVDKVTSIVKESGLNPSNLEIELTESAIIEGSDKIIRTLQELKNTGIQIVIDDFGTGYSNLHYLSNLPIDKIKIDRSFIKNIGKNEGNDAVIIAIIHICNSLKIKTVAEGVEKIEQLNFLKKHHCDEIQGFYFSRPKPPSSLKDTLQKKFIRP